jgi:hypothetical protein
MLERCWEGSRSGILRFVYDETYNVESIAGKSAAGDEGSVLGP